MHYAAKLARPLADVDGDDGAKAKFGKILTYGWIGWSLMHVKWYLEGTLRTTGSLFGQESFGQVGGGIPCFLTAAAGIKQFLL